MLPTARALAAEIAENTSAVSVALAGGSCGRCSARHPWEAHRLDSLAMFRLGQSADVVEGVTSFLENARRSSPAGSLISPMSSRCGRSGRRPWTERHKLSAPAASTAYSDVLRETHMVRKLDIGQAHADMRGGPTSGTVARGLSWLATLGVSTDSALQQLAGHDRALDLVGALVDLGGRRPVGSFRR